MSASGDLSAPSLTGSAACGLVESRVAMRPRRGGERAAVPVDGDAPVVDTRRIHGREQRLPTSREVPLTDDPKDERERELDKELEDLEVGDDADKVTGGSDPCEGGQFTRGKTR